jgi:hypothetical protein
MGRGPAGGLGVFFAFPVAATLEPWFPLERALAVSGTAAMITTSAAIKAVAREVLFSIVALKAELWHSARA